MARRNRTSPSVDYLLTEGVADEIGGALDSQFGHHVGAMVVDGLDAQAEIGGDAADRLSRGDGEEDLELAARKEIMRPFHRAAMAAVDDEPFGHLDAEVLVPSRQPLDRGDEELRALREGAAGYLEKTNAPERELLFPLHRED